MKRVNITHSETGEYQGWFDLTTSVVFTEDTYWNGNNHISRATGSQWNHEELHYTRTGNWVLYRSSQWQGSVDTYTRVSEAEAIRWLLAQSCQDDDNVAALPEHVRQALAQADAQAEL